MTKTVVTIGVFDGVHAGHRQLISHARSIANDLNGELTVASFDPHPTSVLRPDKFLGLLTLPQRRTELLLEQGVTRVEFLNFDSHLQLMHALTFVKDVIVGQLHADVIVVGENFRFGHKAAGSVETLQDISAEFGFEVVPVVLAGDDQAWSSTRIRHSLIAGDVASARTMLGRSHRLTGVVVHGDHRGRELGFPTANLNVDQPLVVPADGVYSAMMHWDGQAWPCAVSVGTNPTFDGVIGRRVEAYVMDHKHLDLYDHEISLDFIDFVRPMLKFDGLDSLIEAMHNDVARAREQIADFLDS